jgi:hypothetical protein
MRYLLVAFVLIFTFTGCNECSDDNNPANSPVENQAPVIHSLTATPASVQSGATSEIACLATDGDGDNLEYTWFSDSGSIAGDYKKIEWMAPDDLGQHWVSVAVNDGMAVTTDSVLIHVVPYDPDVKIEILSTTRTVGFALDVDLEDDKLYVAENSAGVSLFDISDPANVSLIKRFETDGKPEVIDGIPQLGCFIMHFDEKYGRNIISFEDDSVEGYDYTFGNGGVTDIISIMTRDTVRSQYFPDAELVEADVARVLFADEDDGIQIVRVWLDSTDFIVFPIDTLLIYSCDHRMTFDLPGKTVSHVVPLDEEFNTVAVSFLDYGVGFGNVSKEVEDTDGEWYSILDTPGEAQGLAFENNYLFVADGAGGLAVINASDIVNPELVTTWHTDGLENANSVFVRNGRLLLLDEFNGVYFLDVNNPTNPQFMAFSELHSPTSAAFVNDTTVVVSSTIAGLTSIRLKF